MTISQAFALYDHPSQMEPLLPAEHRLGPLLERAHDLIRHSERLAGWSPAGALPGLRRLLRAMNSYYSNKIEGQQTLPLEIEHKTQLRQGQIPCFLRDKRYEYLVSEATNPKSEGAFRKQGYVEINRLAYAAAPSFARVAITSSASKPAAPSLGRPRAARQSTMTGTCGERSSGTSSSPSAASRACSCRAWTAQGTSRRTIASACCWTS